MLRRILAAVLLLGGGFAVGHFALPGRHSTTPSGQENALFQQAFSDQLKGNLKEAEKIYLQILRLDPLNAYAYYDLALIYQYSKDISSATTAYEKTLLLMPNYQPALFNLASIETTTDPAAAIQLYEELQRLPDLKHPDAVAFNLGLLLVEGGHTAEGDAQLRYAVTLTPSLETRIPAKYLPLPPGAVAPPST
jgi:tetratricopeptide (TPR) repeat protein